jgi:hypothetical protein
MQSLSAPQSDEGIAKRLQASLGVPVEQPGTATERAALCQGGADARKLFVDSYGFGDVEEDEEDWSLDVANASTNLAHRPNSPVASRGQVVGSLREDRRGFDKLPSWSPDSNGYAGSPVPWAGEEN